MTTTETNHLEGWKCLIGAKKRPLTEKEMGVFVSLSLAGSERLRALCVQLKASALGFQILDSRLTQAGWRDKVGDDVMVFCASLCDTPGEAVLWAFTLAKMASDKGHVDLGIDSWSATDAFGLGVPERESIGDIWDYQKGHAQGVQGVDNLADDYNNWPKS